MKRERELPLPECTHDEDSILGMLDGSWGDVLAEADFLQPSDFYVEWHGTAWQAAQAVRAEGKPVTFESLWDKLAEWDAVGEDKPIASFAELSAYANHVPPNGDARYFAEAIRKTALRRLDIRRGTALVDAAYRATDEAWAREREEATSYLSAVEVGKPGAAVSNRRSYPILSDLEVEAFTPAQGILGDLLFEDSIAYLFGDSDTWKTFIAVSWCLSIATGTPWLGREVQQGPAVYVPAEGARGLGKRITAWKQHHGFAGQSLDFFVVPMAVNLLDRQAVPTLVGDIRTHPALGGRAPRIIVFDTLASSMDGGDENDTPDANRVTAAARQLKQAFGCNVLMLHHSGNAFAHRMRGNSAYRANADTVIQVKAPEMSDGQKRLPGDVVTLRSVKAKDDAGFEDTYLSTELQEWAREDGTPVNSLVVVATDKKPPARGEAVIMSQSSRTALEELAKLGKPATATEWQEAAKATIPVRRTFYNARDELVARQYVESDAPPKTKGAHYSLTEAGRKVLSASVQDECNDRAIAPTDPTEVSADDGVALMPVAVGASAHELGTAVSANGAGGIYAVAPLHSSCPTCGEGVTIVRDGDGLPRCKKCWRDIA